MADIDARANRRFVELSDSTSKSLSKIKEEISNAIGKYREEVISGGFPPENLD